MKGDKTFKTGEPLQTIVCTEETTRLLGMTSMLTLYCLEELNLWVRFELAIELRTFFTFSENKTEIQ